MRTLGFALLAFALFGAEKLPPEKLIQLARTAHGSAQFREAVLASLPEADLKKGIAYAAWRAEDIEVPLPAA